MNPITKVIVLIVLVCIFHNANAQQHSLTNITYLNEPDISFDKLIEQFKGKVIYLDVWATWCKPCREELQLKKDVKAFAKFAKENNMIILYICCDKNGNTWKQFIKANNLEGYHLLVNQSIDQAFHTTFSVPKRTNLKFKSKRTFFIPRHMIIDQAGTVVDSIAQKQGSAIVYSKLNELLNK